MATCPVSKNCLGALAKLVFALHVRGDLVGHGSGHDVVASEQTYEVRTRSNGSRPNYRRKLAGHFVHVKILRSGPGLTATEVLSRPGGAVANDGIAAWEQDHKLKDVAIV